MFKRFENILENKTIGIMGLISLIGGFIADTQGGGFGYVLLIIIPMFIFALWDEHVKYKTLNVDTIHIPLVIKIGDGPLPIYVQKTLLEKIQKDYELKNYKKDLLKYVSINLDDFLFEFKGDIKSFVQVMNFARDIKKDIHKLEKHTGNRIKLHIAYYRRPAWGFLIGTIFRTESIFVYQNNDYENIFHKVFNIESRTYKEKIDELSLYEIEKYENQNKNVILVIINSASHSVNDQSDKLIEYKNKIKLTLKGNGTIPYNIDWTNHAREIYTVLNELQIQYKEIVIAHSMPESLSIVLGMAIENYWNISITQYNSKNADYDHLYKMNEIDYYI